MRSTPLLKNTAMRTCITKCVTYYKKPQLLLQNVSLLQNAEHTLRNEIPFSSVIPALRSKDPIQEIQEPSEEKSKKPTKWRENQSNIGVMIASIAGCVVLINVVAVCLWG